MCYVYNNTHLRYLSVCFIICQVMVVFFTCSTKKIAKYARFYRATRNTILSLRHKINRDWIDNSINLAKKNLPEEPTYTHYEDVVAAIMTADAVVVDSTVPSMAIGHQVTIALQNDKPVLLLRLNKNGAKPEKLFIEGSHSKNLEVYEYAISAEIKRKVAQFLKKHEDKPKKRFNLVLTGYLNSYLSWASFYYKKTKTDLIHEAVENILEKDSQYKKYLSKQS